MSHGGAREGAGRPPGSVNKASQEAREKVVATGETPLDYMMRVMRDKSAEHQRRDDMAKAAAPYVHPKLSAIEHTGKDGGPIETVDLTDTELARRIAFALTKGAQEQATETKH